MQIYKKNNGKAKLEKEIRNLLIFKHQNIIRIKNYKVTPNNSFNNN